MCLLLIIANTYPSLKPTESNNIENIKKDDQSPGKVNGKTTFDAHRHTVADENVIVIGAYLRTSESTPFPKL